MARRVFFAFHYERDIWRIGQVRNCWVTKPDRETAGYHDAATWESLKKQGDEAIKRWINGELEGTSVMIVLIGTETADRPWVRYEITKSYQRRNGLLGIYIHKIRDKYGLIDLKGDNPFSRLYLQQNDGTKKYLSDMYPTYDWVDDDGYSKMGDWIAEAARRAGR